MIGHNIKHMRELRGWSQETLARKMGYKSKTTISKIEDNINDVNQKKLDKFAKVLGCDVTELLVESYATPKNLNLLGIEKAAEGIRSSCLTLNMRWCLLIDALTMERKRTFSNFLTSNRRKKTQMFLEED